MTKIIKPDKDFSVMNEAAEALRDGELVAFPTETVYGIGANAYLESSAKKIFAVKGRPSDNPLIVHISDIEDAEKIGQNIPDAFYKLAKNFWPGPLTMIVEKKDVIPYTVSGGLDTVGIRMPDNDFARYLIKKANCPVAAPSANISGTVSATEAKYVYDDFKDKIPYIIDGGNCKIGLESTVVNLTCNPPTVLRPGGVTLEELKKVIPDIILHKSIMDREISEISNPASPGMKYKHYSPRCPVYLLNGSLENAQEYIIENIKENEVFFPFAEQKKLIEKNSRYNLGSIENLYDCANKIFDFLRDADKKGASGIYVTSVKEEGIGLALMNRLRKTSGDNQINIRNILFICTGNTCRSPMAEYILKNKNIKGMIVKSRGIYVCCSSDMSFSSMDILDKYDIPHKNFHACQVSDKDIINATEIYTMTKDQRNLLLRHFPDFENKIFTLKDNDITDPYMQPERIYEKTFLEIEEAIRKKFDER